MKNHQTLLSCAGAVLMLAAWGAIPAKATPIPVWGDVNFIGGVTLTTSNLATATTIKAVTAEVTNVPGQNDGDYSAVPALDPVTFFTPLNFKALSTAPLTAVTPLWSFKVGTETYSFDITGPVDIAYQSKNIIDLNGTGIASATGLPSNAAATWALSINSVGGKLTFGFETSVEDDVPDRGSTALLVGLGLTGVCLGLISRRRKAAKV